MQYIEATVPDCRWKLNVILLCKDNIVANFLQIVFAKPAKEKRKHPAFLQFKFAIIDFLKCSQTVWLKRSDPVGNQIIFHTEFWSLELYKVLSLYLQLAIFTGKKYFTLSFEVLELYKGLSLYLISTIFQISPHGKNISPQMHDHDNYEVSLCFAYSLWSFVSKFLFLIN